MNYDIQNNFVNIYSNPNVNLNLNVILHVCQSDVIDNKSHPKPEILTPNSPTTCNSMACTICPGVDCGLEMTAKLPWVTIFKTFL